MCKKYRNVKDRRLKSAAGYLNVTKLRRSLTDSRIPRPIPLFEQRETKGFACVKELRSLTNSGIRLDLKIAFLIISIIIVFSISCFQPVYAQQSKRGRTTDILRPDAAGATTTWIKGGTTIGHGTQNWQYVDEDVSDATGTEVSSTTSGNPDAYNVNMTSTYTFAWIYHLDVCSRAASATGTGIIRNNVLANGTTQGLGAQTTVASTYTKYCDRFNTNPATSAAWTSADLPNIQTQLASASTANKTVTQVWIIYNYTLPTLTWNDTSFWFNARQGATKTRTATYTCNDAPCFSANITAATNVTKNGSSFITSNAQNFSILTTNASQGVTFTCAPTVAQTAGLYDNFYVAYATDDSGGTISQARCSVTSNQPAVSIGNSSTTSVASSTPIVYTTATDQEKGSTYVTIFRNDSNGSWVNISYGLQQNNTATARAWTNNSNADGIYSYYARAFNNLSNNVSSANLTLIIDTTAPTITNNANSELNTSVSRNWTFINVTATDAYSSINTTTFEIAGINVTGINYVSSYYHFNVTTDNISRQLPNNGSATNLTNDWVNLTSNVLLLHFDEASGTVVDYSNDEGGHNMTVSGNTSYGNEGKIFSALNFDGNGDYMTNTARAWNYPITVSLWVNPNALGANNVFIASGFAYAAPPNNKGWLLKYDSTSGNKLHFIMGWGTCGGATLSTGVWQHIVGTIDSSGNCALWINGVKKATGTATNNGLSGTTTRIGSETTSSGYANTMMDELALWNRTLSAAEITAIYDRQAPIFNESNMTVNVYGNDTVGNEKRSLVNSWLIADTNGPTITNNANSELNTSVSRNWTLINVTATDVSPINTTTFEIAGVNITGINYVSSYYHFNVTTDNISRQLPNNGGVTKAVGDWVNLTDNVLNIHFEETSGLIIDSSNDNGGGHNMTVSGNPTYAVDGKIAKAINLDGNGDYMTNTGKAWNYPFTVSLWVNPTSLSGQPVFATSGYSYGAPPNNKGWVFLYHASTFKTTLIMGWDFCGVGPVLTTGVWQHIAATVDGSGNCKYFLNGILSSSGSATNNGLSGTTTFIGAESGPQNYFNGLMDEMALWNRTLTPAEVKSLYDRQAPIFNESNMTVNVYSNDTLGNEKRNLVNSWLYPLALTVSVSLAKSTVSFESMIPGASNNTTSDMPPPFVIRNDGTANVNITIEGDDFFTQPGYQNPTSNYQWNSTANETSSFAHNIAEENLFTWANVPLTGSPTKCVGELQSADTNDQASVNIRITVPSSERPRNRSSTVTFTASQA